MKFLFYTVIILFTTVCLIYAANDTGEAKQCLAPSILSSTKVQMMQQLDDNLSSTNANSVNHVSTFVSSNDQPKLYKDRKKAFFRSLILPGAGEYYLGKHTLARAFFATEVTLWLSYFAFRQYGKWIRDDALAFAATHSAAGIEGKPSQFFVDIGNYIDIYEYNNAKLRFGEYEKVYDEGDFFWSWDLDKNRRKFENMRIAGDRALNRSTFVIGAVFANHLISAIHASWQTHRYNKKLDQVSKSNIQIHINTNYFSGEVSINIQKEF
jgi:hypothetical protein